MTKKRSNNSRRFVVLAILLIAAAGLWLMLQQNSRETITTGANGPKYQVKKTGAGVTVDFSKTGRDLDAAVLKTIKESGYKTVIADREARQAPRQEVEGFIKWENRHITVAVPTENQKTSFADMLVKAVTKAGGHVFATYQDNIEGRPATRLDIGLTDTLEGDPVAIVTHNVWLFTQAGAPASPPKKESEPPAAALYANQPKQAKSKPVNTNQLGRLALVIDDMGRTMEGVADLLALERPLTFAVLPYHPYSATIARQAAAQGEQVILHLPLESVGGAGAETSTITTGMTDAQIREQAGEAMAAVPQIIGVNNHQGSKATADPRVMKTVLAVMRERGLFFLDSRTSSASVGVQTAHSMGMRATENDHFIDNTADVEAIKEELRTAGRLAISQGEAVAIGHIRPHTVTAIREMVPELESMGVRLVFASELAR